MKVFARLGLLLTGTSVSPVRPTENMDTAAAEEAAQGGWWIGGPTGWLLLLLLGLLCWYSIYPFGLLKELGVPHPRPMPFLGNMFWFRKGFLEGLESLVEKYGKVCGYYFGRRMNLVVADPDMLKHILVKDFNNFVNRMEFRLTSKPMSDSIFMLRDEEWKHVRSVLTPTFSAAKMREMSPLINQATDTLLENLEAHARLGKAFDVWRCFGCYSMDVIASVAFGMQVDSQRNPDDPFVRHAHLFFNFTFFRFAMFLVLAFPSVFIPLMRLLPNERQKRLNRFFKRIIQDIIKMRQAQPPEQRRRDFLQLMLDAREVAPEGQGGGDGGDAESSKASHGEAAARSVADGEGGGAGAGGDSGARAEGGPIGRRIHKHTLTDDHILGQAFLFFVAGYETTSNTLGFVSYLLATNPVCQTRLREEIMGFYRQHKEPDYDNIQQLTYLDMVISETLRLYPPGLRFGREALRDCVVKGVRIPAKTHVEVPVGVLHRDPLYWPEPDRFIPERFTAEEKAARHPFVYLPFGAGPRNCIGMRLALLETKVALVRLLHRFTFHMTPDTQVPLQLKSFTTLSPKDAIMLRISANGEPSKD